MTTNDESSDSQCVGQKGTLPDLPTLGDVCFRVSITSSNDQEVPSVEGASVKSVSRGTVMVVYHLLVWNFYRGVSMVIPSSHSTFGVSETQTYFKESLPTSAASCSNFPVVFLLIPPLWRSSAGRPVLVHVSRDNDINANLFLFPFGLDLGMVFISVFWWQIRCEKNGFDSGKTLIPLSCRFLICQEREEMHYWFCSP